MAMFDPVQPPAPEEPDKGSNHDRWVIGASPKSDEKYLLHLGKPRFVAKIEEFRVSTLQHIEDVKDMGVGSDGGGVFYDFIWFDARPSTEDETEDLLEEGLRAVEEDVAKTATSLFGKRGVLDK